LHGKAPGVQRRVWYRDPDNFVKRGFDVLAAGTGLLLLSPVLAAFAVAIKWEDGGPILYVHPRVGRGGKQFPFFKFRTMRVGSDRSGYEIDAADQRITRIGSFLRRWSLDELPQLLNVLRGEMSLIGPRPTLAYQVEQYDVRQRRRLDVRPGLTGLAQVRGRNSLTWPQRIEIDIEYIESYSLLLDVQILSRTFAAVVNPDGIYGHGWEKK
jgi:lipopolysaccharide/colanic/teichoic acid biosynthesis glycosyltransferase